MFNKSIPFEGAATSTKIHLWPVQSDISNHVTSFSQYDNLNLFEQSVFG